eukprot:276187-Pelagomonas_calceolata.AAC.8
MHAPSQYACPQCAWADECVCASVDLPEDVCFPGAPSLKEEKCGCDASGNMCAGEARLIKLKQTHAFREVHALLVRQVVSTHAARACRFSWANGVSKSIPAYLTTSLNHLACKCSMHVHHLPLQKCMRLVCGWLCHHFPAVFHWTTPVVRLEKNCATRSCILPSWLHLACTVQLDRAFRIVPSRLHLDCVVHPVLCILTVLCHLDCIVPKDCIGQRAVSCDTRPKCAMGLALQNDDAAWWW